MARTYLSGLVAIVHTLCKYTTKYGPLLSAGLSSPEKELLNALIAACNAFMQSSIPETAKND